MHLTKNVTRELAARIRMMRAARANDGAQNRVKSAFSRSVLKQAAMVMLASAFLSACTQTIPTEINQHPVQSRLESQEIMLRDGDDVARVADLYKRGGTKPVEIIATYSSESETTALQVAQTAQRKLAALGVKSTVSTLPASENRVMALVTALDAGKSAACAESIPGMRGAVAAYGYDGYGLGCEIDERMGQQVARTRDLEGRVPGAQYEDSADGLRAGSVIDGYRNGKPSEPLNGLAASDAVDREK